MATVKVLSSRFIYSVPTLAKMRALSKEFVFIGRSNVGKSSLINTLCHKKDLARTSKTPGRTRHAVVYELILLKDDDEKTLTLVDLPGFGYASMSKTEALECEKLIFSYVEERAELSKIFLLLDIRREPDEREKHIIKIAKERGIELFLILTKCDKIALSERKPAKARMAKSLNLDPASLILHSTFDEEYTNKLRELML